MKEPVLVILAAGMGSRYGGLKQIDPVDEWGHILMDFSLFDAVRAGFKKVVFIIKPEIEDVFKEVIGKRISKHMNVTYVYQEKEMLPEGFSVPDGREKPWGTGQAILSCKEVVDAPFAVINADDYYGVMAYDVLYNYLKEIKSHQYCMVGYQVENTLTDYGHVSRGVCEVVDGALRQVIERTRIEKRENQAVYTEDGVNWEVLEAGTTVSMNMWGFEPSIFNALEEGFTAFLEKEVSQNPLKAEFFLPTAVDGLIAKGEASVAVLTSTDKWHGVTYKEDKQAVVEAIKELKKLGIYPEKLWGEV